MRALVVGLGSSQRGDDAAGPTVAAAIADMDLPGVAVMVQADPSALLDLREPLDVLVLVDAMRSGAQPGRVMVLGEQEVPSGSVCGTHDLCLGDVIGLARALDRLPPRVAVVAVEAAHFDHGAPMSPGVHEAVPQAVNAVVQVLETAIKQALD